MLAHKLQTCKCSRREVECYLQPDTIRYVYSLSAVEHSPTTRKCEPFFWPRLFPFLFYMVFASWILFSSWFSTFFFSNFVACVKDLYIQALSQPNQYRLYKATKKRNLSVFMSHNTSMPFCTRKIMRPCSARFSHYLALGIALHDPFERQSKL